MQRTWRWGAVKGLGVTGGRGTSGGSGGLAAPVAVAWDAYDVSGGNAWQLEQCWLVWARETCRIHKSSIVQQSGACQHRLKACWQRSACKVQRNPLWLPGRGRRGQVAFSLVLAGLCVQPLTPGERERGGQGRGIGRWLNWMPAWQDQAPGCPVGGMVTLVCPGRGEVSSYHNKG